MGERGRLIRVRAPHIEAQDTTGAGDVFAAGFVVACMEGRALPEAGRFAVAASALSVQGLGARGYLPDREQVLHIVHGADVSS